MALSNEDWTEVLDHTRRRIREAGFSELDERVALDFQHTGEGRTDFLRYLSGFTSGLTERSYSGYSKALKALQEVLVVEGSGRVEGIELVFNQADSRIYGSDRIDLAQVENLLPLLTELKLLKEYVATNGVLDE